MRSAGNSRCRRRRAAQSGAPAGGAEVPHPPSFLLAPPSSQLQAEEVRVAEPPWPCERLFRSLCRAAAAPGADMVSHASGGAVRDALGPGRRDSGAAPGLPTVLCRGLKGDCTLSPAAPEELLFPLGEVRRKPDSELHCRKEFEAGWCGAELQG